MVASETVESYGKIQSAMSGPDALGSGFSNRASHEDQASGPVESGDTASDQQVQMLQDELRAMTAKASDLEAQATQLQLEAGGNGSSEAQHAHIQAATMRASAEQAKAEISNAPRDGKTGKKRISASKISAMTGALGQIAGQGSREVTMLAEGTEHAHEVKGEAFSESRAAKPKTLLGHVKQACHGAACAVGIAAPMHIVHRSMFKQTIDALGQDEASAMHGLNNVLGELGDGISTAGHAIKNSGAAAVAALSDYATRGVGEVRHLANAAQQHLSDAAGAAGSAIRQHLAAAKTMASGAMNGIGNVYHRAVAGITGAFGAMLPHTPPAMLAHATPTVAHAKPATAHAQAHTPAKAAGNMAKALHEALALKLPAHPLHDALEWLSPLVPNMLTPASGLAHAH